MEMASKDVGAIHLDPVALYQLRLISKHGLTWPGDLISKPKTKHLVEIGLAATIEGYYCITCEGTRWLRMAGFQVGGSTA